MLGNITKLNDPGGECTVKGMHNEDEVILLGKIKSLKLGGAQGKSVLDASELEAQEILFGGDMLGDDGLARMLSECKALSAAGITARIQRGVEQFGDGPLGDDMALLALKAAPTR